MKETSFLDEKIIRREHYRIRNMEKIEYSSIFRIYVRVYELDTTLFNIQSKPCSFPIVC